jgi:hypothetical protein
VVVAGKVGIGKAPDSTLALDVKGTVKASGGILPAYDSGWIFDGKGGTDHEVPFNHKLGRLPTLVMLYFTPNDSNNEPEFDKGKEAYPVPLATWDGVFGNPHTTAVTKSQIIIRIFGGNNLLRKTWRTNAWTSYKTGWWRVIVF